MKAFHVFFVTFILVVILGLGFLFVKSGKLSDVGKDLTGKAKQKTVELTAKQLEPLLEQGLVSQLEAQGLTQEQAQAIVDSIPEEDKQKVTEIAANHLDQLPDAASYVQSGDVEGLTELLQENLTDEETVTIQNIMTQYTGLIPGSN